MGDTKFALFASRNFWTYDTLLDNFTSMTDLTFHTYGASCGLVTTSRGFEVVIFGGYHTAIDTQVFNVDQGTWVRGLEIKIGNIPNQH